MNKVATAIVLAFTVPAAAATIGKRITGGSDALPGDFPFIVSITNTDKGNHDCGGSLLDSSTVLTAAHCVPKKNNPGILIVKAGLDRTKPEVEARVQSYKTHPQYNPQYKPEVGYYSDDIAVLKLSTPIEKSETISYAMLPPNGSDPLGGSSAITAGWGSQFDGGNYAEKLRKASMPVKERKVCVDVDILHYAENMTNVVCAGGNGQNVCHTDSGGPLVDEKTGQLIGVTSWVIPDENQNRCLGQMPSVFTRVGSYIPFITENMAANPLKPEAAAPKPPNGGPGGSPTARPWREALNDNPNTDINKYTEFCGTALLQRSSEICVGTQKWCSDRLFEMTEEKFDSPETCLASREAASKRPQVQLSQPTLTPSPPSPTSGSRDNNDMPESSPAPSPTAGGFTPADGVDGNPDAPSWAQNPRWSK
ncbi:hypothetical protein HIM_05706 [Hirsutella minnesotensis 3608]|uniref:Peptidase S1 domain-containing protein n=1 Tax=Hirsutella minnesotensis 3608 TaxID=1043627 RepID=A0A0F7ZP68_9HYPO|nr:hypothetical protein HIM_05706 [Hirsutella minnesotensis 3608]